MGTLKSSTVEDLSLAVLDSSADGSHSGKAQGGQMMSPLSSLRRTSSMSHEDIVRTRATM